LLTDVYDELDKLEKAGIANSSKLGEITDAEAMGVSRSFSFKPK
jgi:hypothetical protein